MEQGATIMPMVQKEPLDIDAAMSFVGWTKSASAQISGSVRSLSLAKVIGAALLQNHVCLDFDVLEEFEQPHAVSDARGAAYPDDQ